MKKTEWESMNAEIDEAAKKIFERAILSQKRNIYKVTFRAKSDSKEMLEIFTVASGVDNAIKKVLCKLYSDKKKYSYIFHRYAVYTYDYDKTEEYRHSNDASKLFYAEKRPTAEMVTGVKTLFVE